MNLVGYCEEKGKHMLVYVYMSNGSLASHLYSKYTFCFIETDKVFTFYGCDFFNTVHVLCRVMNDYLNRLYFFLIVEL